MLELCIDLLRTLNEDADREFQTLSDGIVDTAQRVSELENSSSKEEQELVTSKINNLLTLMQFSDRFCQRLDNAKQSLCYLHQAISESSNDLAEAESQSTLEQARNIFTTEQERELFDKIFNTTKQSQIHINHVSLNDNILFFDEEEQIHE